MDYSGALGYVDGWFIMPRLFGRTGVYGGAEAPFDPLSTSPDAFWDSHDCSGVGEGGSVLTWPDATGNGWTFTGGATKPVYLGNTWAAGVPCIHFVPGASAETATGLQTNLGTEATHFLVLKPITPATDDRIYNYFTATQNIGVYYVNSSVPLVRIAWAGVQVYDNPTVASPYQVMVTNNQLYVNNTLRLDPIGVGAYSGNSANKMIIDPYGGDVYYVGCCGFWNRNLTAEEITNIFAWATSQGWT